MMSLFAQQNYNVSGVVTDQVGERLPFVEITTNTDSYYSTNEYGEFYIPNIQEGDHHLIFKFLGYHILEKKIEVHQNLNLKIQLEEATEKLSEVSIKGRTKTEVIENTSLAVESIKIDAIEEKINFISDELNKLSGVRVRVSGSLGDNSQISLNGLSGTAVRVFIDGIPLDFLYPRLDIANLPIVNIERVNVYKGVLPIDLGVDALGGGINIVTKNVTKNELKVKYGIGSFNTHLGGFNVNLVDKHKNFISVNGGVHYSDNDFKFTAEILKATEIDGIAQNLGRQRVRRFHDAYRLQYTGITVGTRDKQWADQVQLTFNYLNRFKEVNNASIITNTAIGEAFENRENYAIIGKYRKALLNDRLGIHLITNFSKQSSVFTDTSLNVYNWLGEVFDRRSEEGELGRGITDRNTETKVVRSSLHYKITNNHRFVFSNLWANEKRNTTVTFDNVISDFPEQNLTKNIAGLGYEGSLFHEKLDYFAGVKYYDYETSLAFENNQNEILELAKDDNFWGWNGGIKYMINNHFSLKSSYERAYLIPNISQLAGAPPTSGVNTELNPEESDNYNFGIDAKYNDFHHIDIKFSANGFIREQRNQIFLNIVEAFPRYENLGDVEVKGVETELFLSFYDKMNITANFTYLSKEFKSFPENNNATINTLIGAQVPNTPPFFYDIQLEYYGEYLFKKNIPWNAYCSFHYVDEFNFLLIGGNDTIDSNPDRFLGQQFSVDTGFSLKWLKNKNLTTAVNVTNLFDKELFDNLSIPKPGRNFNAKIIYELDQL